MKEKNMPNAALFDLDGVLIDSEGTYTRIWTDIESVYRTGQDNFALKIKGTTLDNILNTYYPDMSVRAKVVELLKQNEQTMEYPVFPGVMEFLRKLAERGIPAAIVTSSGDAKMRRLFASNPEFGSLFGAVITDSQVQRSKPDPQGYILAAAKLGVEPGRCFVFEDSFNGLRAGRAAGATVIALSTTNPADSLSTLADAVIPGFENFSVDDMLSVSRL